MLSGSFSIQLHDVICGYRCKAWQQCFSSLCTKVVILQELGDDPTLTFGTCLKVTFSFLYLFVASGILGGAFGLTSALLLKASPHIHVHQVSSTVIMTAAVESLLDVLGN